MVPKTKSSPGTVPVSRFQYKNHRSREQDQVQERSQYQDQAQERFQEQDQRLETVNYLYIEGNRKQTKLLLQIFLQLP